MKSVLALLLCAMCVALSSCDACNKPMTSDSTAANIDQHKAKLKADWAHLKSEVKGEWRELTEEDLAEVNGEFDKLVDKIREEYDESKEQAEAKLNEFLNRKKK